MTTKPLSGNTPPIAPLALRPRDAAVALGISERLLHDWTMQYGLPCVRVGRIKIYPVEPIKTWLAARLEAPHRAGVFPQPPHSHDTDRTPPTRSS